MCCIVGPLQENHGGDFLFADGYATLVEHLAAGAGEVLLGRAVTRVVSDSEGVRVHCRPAAAAVSGRGAGSGGEAGAGAAGAAGAADATVLSCDYAIVSLPLGVLKECHQSMFDPPLGKGKAQAIERLGMSAMNKGASAS